MTQPPMSDFPESTMPTVEIMEEQAKNNADLRLAGSGTTITPWTHILFMENIGSSIHGKSNRPIT